MRVSASLLRARRGSAAAPRGLTTGMSLSRFTFLVGRQQQRAIGARREPPQVRACARLREAASQMALRNISALRHATHRSPIPLRHDGTNRIELGSGSPASWNQSTGSPSAATSSCRRAASCIQQDDLTLFRTPRRIAQGLHDVFAFQVRAQSARIASTLWPAPIWPRIIATVTRIPRMQALPPMMSGCCVMRCKGPMIGSIWERRLVSSASPQTSKVSVWRALRSRR
jgi:hypothetical protein